MPDTYHHGIRVIEIPGPAAATQPPPPPEPPPPEPPPPEPPPPEPPQYDYLSVPEGIQTILRGIEVTEGSGEVMDIHNFTNGDKLTPESIAPFVHDTLHNLRMEYYRWIATATPATLRFSLPEISTLAAGKGWKVTVLFTGTSEPSSDAPDVELVVCTARAAGAAPERTVQAQIICKSSNGPLGGILKSHSDQAHVAPHRIPSFFSSAFLNLPTLTLWQQGGTCAMQLSLSTRRDTWGDIVQCAAPPGSLSSITLNVNNRAQIHNIRCELLD